MENGLATIFIPNSTVKGATSSEKKLKTMLNIKENKLIIYKISFGDFFKFVKMLLLCMNES
jgi:hypothetical protein